MKRWIISALLFITAGSILFTAIDYYARNQQQKLLEESSDQAAKRGVTWLINHKGDVPAFDSIWLLGSVYNVASDEAMSKELLSAIQQVGSTIPKDEINIKGNKYSSVEDLRPVLLELLARKCSGEDVAPDAANVKKISDSLEPSVNLGLLYMLKELGIGDNNQYNGVVSGILQSFNKGQNNSSSDHLNNALTEITHAVVYESDYFGHYVSPNAYKPELAFLNDSIESLLSSPEVVHRNLDLLSQVLYSLKLLQQKPNEKVNSFYRGLIEIQNNDGSWSQEKADKEFTFHNTAVAVIALTKYPDTLQARKVYCTN